LCLDIHTLSLFQKQSRTVYSNNTMKYTALLVLAFAAVAIADTTPCTGPSCPAKPEYKLEPVKYTEEVKYEPVKPPCKGKCKLPRAPNPVEHEHNKRVYDINFLGAIGIKMDHKIAKALAKGGKIKDFFHNRKADFEGLFEAVGYKIALKRALHECNKKRYHEECEEKCKPACTKKCEAKGEHGMCHDEEFKLALTKCTTVCHKVLEKRCTEYEEESSSSSSSSSEQKYEKPKTYPKESSSSSSSSSSSEQKYDTPKPGYQAPKAGYEAPKAGYPAPKAGYPAPKAGYPAP